MIDINHIVKDFKYSAKLLLDLNKRTVIKTLEKFYLWRLYNYCPDLSTPNTNDWIVYCWNELRSQPGADPTYPCWGPEVNLPSPTGYDYCDSFRLTRPDGDVSYETISRYIDIIDSYINFDKEEDTAALTYCTAEIRGQILYEKSLLTNITDASNYHTSMVLELKRKVWEYDTEINKLKSQLFDYKTQLQAEYAKTPASTQEIQQAINTEYNKRTQGITDPTLRDNILQQVTADINAQYSADITQKKFETLSAGWFNVQDQIDDLTKQRDEIKKLVAPEASNAGTNIPMPRNVGNITSAAYRHQELKSMLQQLYAANASNDQIADIVNKLNALVQ